MIQRSTSIILLGFLAVATLVQCNRNGHKEPIFPGTNLKDQKTQQCSVKLGSQEVRVDTEKISIAGQTMATPLCQLGKHLSDYSRYTSDKGEAPKVPYQLSKPQHHRYTVGKGDGPKAKVALKLGVDFILDPSEHSDEATDKVIKQARSDAFLALRNDCVSMLKSAWDASNLGVDLDVHFYCVGRDCGTDGEVVVDQTIVLAGPPAREKTKAPRFVFADWPTYGQLITKAAKDDCDTTSCSGQTAPQNRRFCAHFAHVVGQFLGLSAPEAASSVTCESHHLAETAEVDPATPTPKPTAAPPSFMSYSADAPDFWEKVRFSRSDLKTIVGPACLGQVVQVPKPKVKFDTPTPVPADDE